MTDLIDVYIRHPQEDRPLDALISLNADQGQFLVTLHARGDGRNSEYASALEALLQRTLSKGWTLVEVLLASRIGRQLPLEDRRVHLSPYISPNGLSKSAEIAREIMRALPDMARAPDARPGGGNPTKKIQLRFEHAQAELMDLLSALLVQRDESEESEAKSTLGDQLRVRKSATAPSKRGQGWSPDSARNGAVEMRAMEVAKEYLSAEGWDLVDTSANHPYDLVAEKDGTLCRVEVKGTTQGIGTVEVTYGEVDSARTQHTMLFVVYNISAYRKGVDWRASKGDIHIEDPWLPDSDNLLPVRYRYLTISQG